MNTSKPYVTPDVPPLKDDAFLAYLREHKPYLFDIEMAVSTVMQETGYGEVSFQLRILHGLVEKGSSSTTMEKFYVRRVNNGHVNDM